MRHIYLDHNATTPIHPDVVEKMMPSLRTSFGNPSSIHSFGRETKTVIEESRETVARAIGAHPQEIFFTASGTESDNTAIKGTAFFHRSRGSHIITSAIEHHAVLHTCRFLEREGFQVTYVPVDRWGLIDPADVADAVTDETILVSIMHANNEVGTIQPLDEIGAICREKGILFHTDAVQSFGKVPVDVETLAVDLLSLSGHKFYGPKGTGVLYIRQGVQIRPLIHGGSHERNRRAGTENVAGIVGIAEASRIAAENLEAEAEQLTLWRDSLFRRLAEKIDGMILNGHETRRLPGTLNVSFAGIEGEAILLNLDLKGVAVSSGSACTSEAVEPSHVLSAMGIAPNVALGSIRFSFGRENTAEDVDTVVDILPGIIDRLRAMSPTAEE